jgi:hypothetical protein
VLAHAPLEEAVIAADLAAAARAAPALAHVQRELTLSVTPPVGAAPLRRWPNKLRRALASAPNPSAREAAEASERARWLGVLQGFVLEAALPSAAPAGSASNNVESCGRALALRSIGRGRRARTLRKKARDWMPVRAYLLATTGSAWPKDVWPLMDYLADRASGGCGRSVPTRVLQALQFLEEGGGVPEGARLCVHPQLLSAARELGSELGAVAAPRRKAPRELAQVQAARERLIVDESRSVYLRAYAWWKSLQLWASLRFDDHRGLAPEA